MQCVYGTGEGWRGVTIKCSLEFTHVYVRIAFRQNIRIYQECEGAIEKSVPRIAKPLDAKW